MKKIAFLADGHYGSTLPLAKYFTRLGYSVDYYIFCLGEISDREAIKITQIKTKRGAHVISKCYAPDIYEYVNSPNFRLCYISTFRPYKSIFLLRNLIDFINTVILKKIIKKINGEKYHAINLIGRNNSEILLPFINNLQCHNVATSLHEVCSHYKPDYSKPTNLLKTLFINKRTIIVHSQKSLEDILKYHEADKSYIHHINFGLFETYKTIKKEASSIINKPYMLFFGHILPYKGLNVLYDAINLLTQENSLGEVKVVVAGKGNDPILDCIRNDERFVLLNHFLTNEEIVTLIENSRFVVCPYLSVSQSGITQTVFTFSKPVIASNIGSFPKVLFDGENGLLFEAGNSEDLAKKMSRLISDENFYVELCDNVNKYESLHPEYSWFNIVDKYKRILLD